jgi:hypothetical protein
MHRLQRQRRSSIRRAPSDVSPDVRLDLPLDISKSPRRDRQANKQRVVLPRVASMAPHDKFGAGVRDTILQLRGGDVLSQDVTNPPRRSLQFCLRPPRMLGEGEASLFLSASSVSTNPSLGESEENLARRLFE